MTDLERAIRVYNLGDYAFVIVKDGYVLATGTHEGIRELLDAVAQHGETLRGATLADKIVGKAVAMVATYVGIAQIYTPLGSQAAHDFLQSHQILFRAERLVPLIRNKRNDGPCPMERLTLPLTDPADALTALHDFVAHKRAIVAAPS
ncbi:MAG TPA: DUF1893 domain-containing protein [Anaerolineae bacterium]|nr:DUF1893 domain-containing protein [Anaerolineae bacterium]